MSFTLTPGSVTENGDGPANRLIAIADGTDAQEAAFHGIGGPIQVRKAILNAARQENTPAGESCTPYLDLKAFVDLAQ
jgi:hypothetical protein